MSDIPTIPVVHRLPGSVPEPSSIRIARVIRAIPLHDERGAQVTLLAPGDLVEVIARGPDQGRSSMLGHAPEPRALIGWGGAEWDVPDTALDYESER